jgi:hypothetical protein
MSWAQIKKQSRSETRVFEKASRLYRLRELQPKRSRPARPFSRQRSQKDRARR